MNPLKKALIHINTSLPKEIDEETFVSCLTGSCIDKQWKGHILSFFLETPIHLMHEIVLSGVITFEELMNANKSWKAEEYTDDEITRWIQEMAYLSLGKAAELGIARFA